MQFTYEQKDQFFGERAIQTKQKEGIGKLLNKYGRRAPDDQQDQQIQRKKLVYPANSLNYSQIYSDLRIDYKEKLRPSEQLQNTQEKRFFPQTSQLPNYVPNSLPKIKRNSRISNHRESTKYVLHNTSNESSGESGFVRAKAFSISHYDIFRNDSKRMQLSASKPKDNNTVAVNEFLSKNSQILSRSYHKNEENLKVDFESIAQKDLPESQEQESQNNLSYIVQKQPQIQPEHTLQELTKEQIKIESNHNEKKDIKNSQYHQQLLYKVQSKRQTQGQKEERQEFLSRKDSKLSKQSSIRTKNKQVKLEQIKRQYSKKIEEDGKRDRFFSQTKKKQLIQNKDSFSQDKRSEQFIKLEQKIQKSVQLIEIKHQSSEVNNSSKQKEMNEQISKFKQEINKVRKEIHGVKQQMNEVKQEVHGMKEQVHREQSRVSEKKSHQKEIVQKVQYKQPIVKQIQSFEQSQKRTNQKEVIKQQQIYIEGDSKSNAIPQNKFIVSNYIEAYQILKQLQKDLKVPQINFHGLIKGVKKYLQVVAMGGLDHVQQYDMPLNRLKTIKNALLYQRISIVIIAFAFSVGKVKESLKYLINLVGYATNNTLLILKIIEGGTENNNQSKNPILAKSDRLVMKRNFDTIRNNNDIILDSIFKISKQQEAFFEPFKEILKSIGKNSIQQTFYNVLEYFSFFLCVSQLSKNLPFLAVAPNPYLRESIDKRPTLIIDIIQVFCHGTKKSKSHVFRPHTEHFLSEMSQYYQLVSFTCAYPNQIDKVIDILDQKRLIKHRLYRHHAVMKHNVLIKDPQRIGRDLSRLIILDSEVVLMSEEISNTIVVPSWKGNRNDTTLAQLCPILAAIALKKLDCRQSTRKIHEQQQKNEHAGIKYLNFGINLQ